MRALTVAFLALALRAAAAPTTVSVVTFARPGGGAFPGSGVVVSASGHVVTAASVADALPLTATLGNGDVYDDVRVMSVDRRRGFAILKVPAFGLTAAAFVDPAKAPTTGTAWAAGAADVPPWSGMTGAASLAAVALDGTAQADGWQSLRAKSQGAPVLPGSPVLDDAGAVIGLVTLANGAALTVVPARYVLGLLQDAVAGPPPAAPAPAAPPPPPAPEPLPAPAVASKIEPPPEAVELRAERPVAPASRPFSLDEIQRIAVYPFTSTGRVDTFWTSLFMKGFRDHHRTPALIDPYELMIHAEDGAGFQPLAMIDELLADARSKGAQALVVGEGKKYSMGFRLEVRLIETGTGKVLWNAPVAAASLTGPSAKQECVREALRQWPER